MVSRELAWYKVQPSREFSSKLPLVSKLQTGVAVAVTVAVVVVEAVTVIVTSTTLVT